MNSAVRSHFCGTGRRKTASARVRLFSGTGQLTVNGKSIYDYCFTEQLVKQAIAPLVTVDALTTVDAVINVRGGGPSGQAGAIAHGIARALQEMSPDLRPALKKAKHLRRDPRMKERKKPGQPGARKRFQFSKR
jgi:small subunit ribosomal protein S9